MLKPDQKEILADNERLLMETREMRVRLVQATGKVVEAPKLSDGKDILALNAVLTAHFLELARELFVAAPTQPQQTCDHVEAIVARNQHLQAELTTARTELEASRKTIAARDTEIKAMKDHYADFETAVARKSAEIVASAGISNTVLKNPRAQTAGEAVAQMAQESVTAVGKDGKPVVNWTAACIAAIMEQGPPKIQTANIT